MKQINIREALLELDRKTDARYDLTTLYEACKLDDEDKQQLVKYIDAYDHPATINKFLSSKCDAITEALGDDDVSDMKIIDEINDGGDHTLWSLMNKFEDEDLQLKDLTEDVDPEVLEGRLENINFVMSNYVKDSFLIDDVQGSGKEWKVTYNDVTVDVTFDTDWEEYTYYINGKGPYAHSSYEYIASDIANFVDYNHLGQSDDEVDEGLEGAPDENPIIAWLGEHEQAWEDFTAHFVGRDISELSDDEIIGWISEHDQLYADYKNYFKVDECLNEGVDTSNLEPQIKEVVTAVMQENGYEADEIEAYTAVEIKDTVDDMVQVEVRAELGYDDLMELCDKLNPIVAAIDHLAYFEPVTSGIARAFIRNDQSQDIVDEEAVNQWTNKIYDCASMEDLRQVYRIFKDHIDNQQYTDGTVDAVLDVIHKKADMLNESLTEDAKEEYFVGDNESGRIYYNEKDAQAAFDSLKKSGIANPVKMKVTDMREGLTEDYNKGEWVEVNLNTKKNGTPNIIPVKVEKELYHGKTFLGWAWGERQHEYPMSAIVKKIDMDDTDAIIRKYTPSGYMSEKLTLNESDDTDILYDMEDWDEDNTTVTAGNQFIEDGYTWMWFKQCGDTVHLDFDNWAVWWAYRREDEDDEDSAAISGFFVVDTDTGFIDWGPCDTVKEAQEFLQSKVNDWENDDLDESKSIREDANSAANSLFDLLKDYGAISVDKDVDVTRISFRNSEDDSDATLVHHCILSKGYKELNQYGNNPNVTEYVNEAGDTCVKLLIYDDSIAVELSAEDSSQYMESVDKDLTHCTECGKKLNDKGYCETEGCLNGTLKEGMTPSQSTLDDCLQDYRANAFGFDGVADYVETNYPSHPKEFKDAVINYLKRQNESLTEGVEKYIIIAKEDGLNLYYNSKEDHMSTDMEEATIYSVREVALDDYKAVKGRYPTAYIRSTYDIPLLNKPSKKEGFEEDEWDDDELASIYGGDTKNDMPDGVETPEETEARLAKENALKESTKYVVIKADGTYAGIPCETEEEARELSNQHEGSKVHKIEG